jgi:beta-mannanase
MAIILGSMCDDSNEGNESVTADQIKRFIKNSGRGLATVYFTDKWAQNPDIKFPLSKAMICNSYGSTPFIRIQNSEDPDGSPGSAGKYKWKNIIDGKFDKQLKQYAIDIKNFKETVLIEMGTEINGKWFSWADEGPDLFKKGFRYVVKVFRDQDVKNVRFAFHCDATDNPHSKDWYPGDDVVDWCGTSCYGADTKKGCIRTLDECYDNFSSITKKAKLGIFEWGIGSDKDASETFERLPKDYPKIKMLQLWGEKVIKSHKEDDVPDSTFGNNPEFLKAYQQGVKNPAYMDKYTDNP